MKLSNEPDIFSNKLIGHYRMLNSTRKRLESLYSINRIARRDIEQAYSGLFLDAVTSFERMIEDLFIELLVNNALLTNPAYVKQNVTFKSRTVARNVVLGGGNYIDWFPYRLTERRAKAFFKNGKPFTVLDKSDKKTIEQVLVIRNVFAHNSMHSKNLFDEEIINGLTLSPRERTPSGFLRDVYRFSPSQTRFEFLLIELSSLADKLCNQVSV